MAIASVGSLGVGAGSTSIAGLSFSTATNTLAAGDFGLLTVVTDNRSTVDGATNDHVSVSGGAGTWTKLGEWTNTVGGAAADGVTVSLWYFEATGAVPTGTSISISLSGTATDKVCSFWKFTKAANTRIVLESAAATNPIGNTTDASAGFGSAAFSGLASAARLYFRALGKEANSTTALTVSTGFSAITNTRSRNSTLAVGVWGEFRINTSTGETSNPTLAVTGDTAGLFVALKEQPYVALVVADSNCATASDSASAAPLLAVAASAIQTQSGAYSSVPWTPDLLGSQLLVWYDPNSLVGADGARIKTVTNRAGNSTWDATDGTTAPGAILRTGTNGLNGKKVLEYVATDLNSQAIDGSLLNAAVQGSYFAVFKDKNDPNLSVGTASAILGEFNDFSQSHHPWTDGNFYEGFGVSQRQGYSGTRPNFATSYRLYYFGVEGSGPGVGDGGYDWTMDGTLIASSHNSRILDSKFPSNWTHHLAYNDSGNHFDGYLAALCIFDRNLPLADRQKVEGWAAWTYGLQGNLDAAHPYSSAAPTVSGVGPVTLGYSAGSTSVVLTPAASVAATTSAAVAIAPKTALAPASSAIATVSAAVTIAAKAALAPVASVIATVSDALTIAAKAALTPTASVMATISDSPALTPRWTLAPAASIAATISDAPTIAFRPTLAPASSAIATLSDSPDLATKAVLAPAAATIATVSASPAITPRWSVTPAASSVALTTDAVVLASRTALAPAAATAATASDSVVIATNAGLAPAASIIATTSAAVSIAAKAALVPASSTAATTADLVTVGTSGALIAASSTVATTSAATNISAKAQLLASASSAALASDAVAIASKTILAPAASTALLTADPVAIAERWGLAGADSSIATTSGSPSLAVKTPLVPASSALSLISDAVALGSIGSLGAASSAIALTSASPTISTRAALQPASSALPTVANSLTVVSRGALAPAGSAIATTSATLVLAPRTAMTIAPATIALVTDTLAIAGNYVLAPAASAVLTASDAPSLAIRAILEPMPSVIALDVEEVDFANENTAAEVFFRVIS